MDCLFCKIIAGDIPSTKVYEDDDMYAFRDINPEAPCHVLVVPKKHIASADEITADNSAIVAKIYEKIPEIAPAAPHPISRLRCLRSMPRKLEVLAPRAAPVSTLGASSPAEPPNPTAKPLDSRWVKHSLNGILLRRR